MNILCICNQGENRSRTTAGLLSQNGYDNVRYDGFHIDHFKKENLKWAGKIIVYEEEHEEILKSYGWQHWGKCINFDIPDRYYYKQAELLVKIQHCLVEFELI